MATISIVIAGKVQGVFYRQSVKEVADRLGITGYVKNTADGDVFIVATGTQEQLDQLVSWCYEGPSRARVEGVRVEKMQAESFGSFSIHRDRYN